MKIKSFLKKIYLLGISVFYLFQLNAQQSNIIYYMPGVPQNHQLNPATQPWCKFYLGFPGISPLHINVENSAFTLGDVIMNHNGQTITFMHPDADKEAFLSNFKNTNYISADVSSNLISLGFKSAGGIYNTFEISEKVFTRFSYPGDLIDFVIHGNDEVDDTLGITQKFDFSSLGVSATSYLEMAIGMSQKINEKFYIGHRTKILFGQANLTTRRNNITLITGSDWQMSSDVEIDATLPGATIPRDADGNFNLDSITFDDSYDSREILAMATGNFGLGLDLGFHYSISDKFTISGSVLDLGFISWKNSTYNISHKVDTIFEGFMYNSGDTTEFIESDLDAFERTFNSFTNKEINYTTFLPAKIYFGMKFQPLDQIGLSVLSRSEFYKGRIRQQFTFASYIYPIKMISTAISYTIMNNSYDNLGLGISLKAGPFNIFLLSDNIPLIYARDVSSNMIYPYEHKNINLKIGLNLVFGCKCTEEKKIKDLPLIF